MKKSRLVYLSLGFIAGVSYLLACGNSSKVEEAIGQAASSVITALSVTYDNATSKLQAVNVQAAVDELAARPSGSSSISSSQLIGTWVGTQYYNKAATQNVTVTFGSGGTFSCSGGPSLGYSALGSVGSSSICLGSYTWELKGNSILLTPTSGGNDYRVIQVNSADGTNIALFFTLETSTQYEFFYGTKQ